MPPLFHYTPLISLSAYGFHFSLFTPPRRLLSEIINEGIIPAARGEKTRLVLRNNPIYVGRKQIGRRIRNLQKRGNFLISRVVLSHRENSKGPKVRGTSASACGRKRDAASVEREKRNFLSARNNFPFFFPPLQPQISSEEAHGTSLSSVPNGPREWMLYEPQIFQPIFRRRTLFSRRTRGKVANDNG